MTVITFAITVTKFIIDYLCLPNQGFWSVLQHTLTSPLFIFSGILLFLFLYALYLYWREFPLYIPRLTMNVNFKDRKQSPQYVNHEKLMTIVPYQSNIIQFREGLINTNQYKNCKATIKLGGHGPDLTKSLEPDDIEKGLSHQLIKPLEVRPWLWKCIPLQLFPHRYEKTAEFTSINLYPNKEEFFAFQLNYPVKNITVRLHYDSQDTVSNINTYIQHETFSKLIEENGELHVNEKEYYYEKSFKWPPSNGTIVIRWKW